ncbi:MAG: endonuclease domain-containing protein [Rhizobiales bacterium]|nr:endonuclease domain-containing protein [Hyphomicrobiales bacterium]
MAEAVLWNELKGSRLGGFKFVRQFPIGPYYADFLCRKQLLVVEVDGSQHIGSAHDANRDRYMSDQGYSVVRFWNGDVLRRREEVCRTILAALEGQFPQNLAATELRFMRRRERP